MRENPIVGQKFTIGAGPKPVVDKINSYFDATNSIAKALNLLLDRFDHISFQEYSPLDDDLVEVSKSLLLGKRDDDLPSLKGAFTRLKVIMREHSIEDKFGEREAPIFLLDHTLSNTRPNKPTYFCILGLKKKQQVWYEKPRNAMRIDPVPRVATHAPHPHRQTASRKHADIPDKQTVARMSIEFAAKVGFVELKKTAHKPVEDPTMQPGKSSFYRLIRDKKKPLRSISDNNQITDDEPEGRLSKKRPLLQSFVPDKKRRRKASE